MINLSGWQLLLAIALTSLYAVFVAKAVCKILSNYYKNNELPCKETKEP